MALAVGAASWLFVLVAAFARLDGGSWGIGWPASRLEHYGFSLWFVTLVLAPLIAFRDPLRRRAVIDVYLLGVFAVIVSSFLAGPPTGLAEVAPIAAAALSAGLILWAYVSRAR